MSCNRDRKCLNIANDYKTKKSILINACQNLTTDIGNTKSELSSISSMVPNDFLGSKVKTELENITSNLTSDNTEVNQFKNSATTFANAKENEHKRHYEEWKRKEELKNKVKEEEK